MKSIVQIVVVSVVLFLVVVAIFWSFSPGGTKFTEVLLAWLPALFFCALTLAFLSYAARDGEKRRQRRDAHMENVERQLERIAQAVEQLRDSRS